MGCQLVILGCNTASAKALRSIQQNDLPEWNSPDSPLFAPTEAPRRVLGVIRPTAEIIGTLTESRHVGLLATEGTVRSESYKLEINKLFPGISVTGVACPLWVPIIEAGEADSPGADYFVKKRIDQLMRLDPQIDAIILGCTHYPLLMPKIVKYVPQGVRLVPQGDYVASSLQNYFLRHTDIERECSKNGSVRYLTTEHPDRFQETAQYFLPGPIVAEHIDLS